MTAAPFPPHNRGTAAQTQPALALLERSRRRPTLLRIHVLEGLLTLDAAHGGTTVDQLYIHLQRHGTPVSLPSIYKVLAELVAAQAVDRHASAQGPTVFAIQRPGARTRLVCSSCQAVLGLDASALRKPLLDAARAQGFEVEAIAFTLHGRCSACAAARPAPTRPARNAAMSARTGLSG